jgi:hypothetical protein
LERAVVTPRETELQVWQQALIDLVVDARERMTPAVYVVWVEFLCSMAAREAARCASWEERAA